MSFVDSAIGAFGGQASLTQRLLSVQISLQSPTSPSQPLNFASGSNVATYTGHRTSVRISNSGGADNHATVAIWGMTQSDINTLSQLGIIYDQIRRNKLIISAGDSFSGLSAIYGADIYLAYADYNQQPEVPMIFTCMGGLTESVVNRAPTTFQGVTDVATLMAGWANLMGLGLENNSVNGVKLANPYYGGNVWQRIQAAAADVGIVAQIVEGNTLAIWPKGKARNNQTVPLISPQTGMIGYPVYAPGGYAIIRHLFNPQVKLGGVINVQSSIPIANRRWVVYKLDLALDSLLPHGEWSGAAYCYPEGFAAPFPPQISITPGAGQ